MRIGIIGVGRMGVVHARTLANHPEVSSVVVADVDAARAAETANRLGVEALGVDEVLVSSDAVVIAAATSSHADLLHAAAEAGIPAFCEKPVALELDSTLEVVEHIGKAGIPVQIGFQRRFDAGYRAARDRVADGGLGSIYVVRMAGHDPAPPHEDYIPASGGIFRDFCVHDFDALRFVTGQEVEEVYADGEVIAFPMFARYGDVDTAVVSLRLTSGTLGILSCARHDPLGYDVRMEVMGSEDSVAVGWNGRTPLASVEPDGPPRPTHAYRDFQDRFRPAYEAEMGAFMNVAAGREETPCSAEDAMEALRVALACDRSLREHRPVRLEEVA